MINGKARNEALVVEVGIENAERFRQEQPLVDQRAARQRAEVEALDLGFDHLLLDAAADEIEVLLEPLLGILTIVLRPGDHDLLDLGTAQHRLVADAADIHRHLAPAIDLVAETDDFRFNNRPAGFLRGQIGTRQEHLAHSQQTGDWLLAVPFDMFVEEIHRDLDQYARTIARHAIGIDRAAVPHRLQRIDGRGHHPALRLAIRGCHQAHAAGIAFQFGAIHADIGNAGAFLRRNDEGCGHLGHGFFACCALLLSGASAAPSRLALACMAASIFAPINWPVA